MANISQSIAIKDAGFKEGFSYSLIWIFINYNVVMQWINIDEWVTKYNQYDKPTKHNIYFIYILFKIYSNTIICLMLLWIVLMIIYFLILKMLSFDSGLFNRIINGDKNVIKEFLPNKNEENTSSTNAEISTTDLYHMIFSSIFQKKDFMIQHVFIVSMFSVLFSIFISSYKYFSNRDNRKVNLQVYFMMLFIIINFHFSYTRFLQ